MIIRPAQPSDHARFLPMLAQAGLPTSDIGGEQAQSFLIAEDAGELLGCIAAEQYGRVALLRSLVVLPAARGQGVGVQLVSALEENIDAEVEELWLLTMDQQHFFEKRGFVVAERSAAPHQIAATEEFSSLCPSSAVLLCKRQLRVETAR